MSLLDQTKATPINLTDTQIATLIPTVFSKMLHMLEFGQSAFEQAGMYGNGDKPIYTVTEFSDGREKGKTCRVPLEKRLSSLGVMGDNTLSGNEEIVQYSSTPVVLDQFRNGVKTLGKLADQSLTVNIVKRQMPLLADWYSHRRDVSLITAAAMDPTAYVETGEMGLRINGVIRGGMKSSWAELTAADTMTVAGIRRLARAAGVRGIAGLRIPGKKIRGVLLCTPGQIADLEKDPEYIAANQLAQMRGDDNPIFTGAIAMIAGIVIREDCHDPVLLGSFFQTSAGLEDVGSGVGQSNATGNKGVLKNSSLLYQEIGETFDRAQAIFFGANAIAYAPAVAAHMEKDAVDDYGNVVPLGVAGIYGFRKIKINLNSVETGAETTNRDYAIMYYDTGVSKLAA